jgi:hypothetical protein
MRRMYLEGPPNSGGYRIAARREQHPKNTYLCRELLSPSDSMPFPLSPAMSKMSTNARGQLQTRPPEPNLNDHRIACQNGSTTALQFTAHRLNDAKKQAPGSTTQQLHDLIRENGNLRQEVKYYRTCTGRAHVLRESVHEVAQKMTILFFSTPTIRASSTISDSRWQKISVVRWTIILRRYMRRRKNGWRSGR